MVRLRSGRFDWTVHVGYPPMYHLREHVQRNHQLGESEGAKCKTNV